MSLTNCGGRESHPPWRIDFKTEQNLTNREWKNSPTRRGYTYNSVRRIPVTKQDIFQFWAHPNENTSRYHDSLSARANLPDNLFIDKFWLKLLLNQHLHEGLTQYLTHVLWRQKNLTNHQDNHGQNDNFGMSSFFARRGQRVGLLHNLNTVT